MCDNKLFQISAKLPNYYRKLVTVISSSIRMTQSGAEVNTVTVTAGRPSDIVCTAIGTRPVVVIDWYHQLRGGHEYKITEAVNQVNYTNMVDNYTFDTVSTLLYNASREHNGGTLRCMTTGQEVAESRESIASLNVQCK